MPRNQTLPDQLLAGADRALRAMFAPARPSRPAPGAPGAAPAAGLQGRPAAPLSEEDRRLAAGLMRVNHAGEIAAQGLYHGQALVARDPAVRGLLDRAAREETDHLAWCEQRLTELNDRPSLLQPFWYAGSFAIGVVAGALSDRVSLGFVAETERQVEQHLDTHLQRLPQGDARSRAIVEGMRADERAHGELARHSGGVSLPRPVRRAMQMASRLMTGTARWV
jgi:ubiquinone biosynthesis monooxygenase Coq7